MTLRRIPKRLLLDPGSTATADCEYAERILISRITNSSWLAAKAAAAVNACHDDVSNRGYKVKKEF